VELLLSTAVPLFSCSIPVFSSKRLREADTEIEVLKAAPPPAPKIAMDKTTAYALEDAPAERFRGPSGGRSEHALVSFRLEKRKARRRMKFSAQ
jgi:hypothetical protein